MNPKKGVRKRLMVAGLCVTESDTDMGAEIRDPEVARHKRMTTISAKKMAVEKFG